MRLAHCPMCHGHNVNNYKKREKWFTKCYDCGYTSTNPLPSRKLSRYSWNLNYERLTGEKLPDEACGRQKGAFMKKEKRAGLDQEVQFFDAHGEDE